MRPFLVFLVCAASAFPLASAITGTVVGPDGAPISDVRVAAFRPRPMSRILHELDRGSLTTTTTNKDGAFTLEVDGHGLVEIQVVKDGYAPADALTATDEPVATIALRRASDVEGKVTANGKPVADASVIVLANLEGRPLVIVTNAEGKYRVPDPRVWAQSILIRHPAFAPAVHPATSPDFALDPGREIHGSVVDASGRPATATIVELGDILSATTDDAGKFTVAHAPREATYLRARGTSGIATVTLAAGEPHLKLQPAARLSGVIRDAAKRPLSGIPVAANSQSFGDSAVSDANGAFAIDVPRGKYALSVDWSVQFLRNRSRSMLPKAMPGETSSCSGERPLKGPCERKTARRSAGQRSASCMRWEACRRWCPLERCRQPTAPSAFTACPARKKNIGSSR